VPRDIKQIVTEVIRELRPDLDHYRKSPRFAKVKGVRSADGQKVVDLDILLNDCLTVDETEERLSNVPLFTGGIVPRTGTKVVVNFMRGDPGRPVVVGIGDIGSDNLSEFMFKIPHYKVTLDTHGKIVMLYSQLELLEE